MQSQPLQMKTWTTDILFLLFSLGCLFFILLGTRPLSLPDEGNYAEIVREMVASGNFITPYLNEIKFFEKPIFLYWLASIAVKIGGLNLWSIRSVSAILAVFGCIMTYIVSRKLYDRRTGLISAFILGTSVLYFALGHLLTMDLTVSIFCTACLYAFLLGSAEQDNNRRRAYFWAAAIASGCAVLTKGLIGLVLPAMIIAAWMLVCNQWSVLKRASLFSSAILFLLVILPWHVLVSLHNPEFFHYYIVKQHLLRYFTPTVGHPQPFWYYIPIFIFGFFPWVVFVPQAIKHALPRAWSLREQYKNEIFFLLWAVLIYVFFTVAKTKLTSYILPMMPPLAILTARYLASHLETKSRGVKWGYAGLVLISFGIAVLFSYFPRYYETDNVEMSILLLSIAALVIAGGGVISFLLAWRSHSKALLTTIVTFYVGLLVVIGALPYVDTHTLRPLTTALKSELQPAEPVIAFNHHFQDVSYYLERRVHILNSRKLFKFGMEYQDSHDWMIDNHTFSKIWRGDQRAFAFMHLYEYHSLPYKYPDEQFYVWGATKKNVLVSNRPKSEKFGWIG